MKTQKKKLWLGAALLALSGMAVKAQAAGAGSPSFLNIDVTISASKSVSVSGIHVSSQATTFDGTTFLLAATSTAAVKNDSGILQEGFQLSTLGHSIDATTGGPGWTIAGSSSNLAADNVAVQAVFGSSKAAIGGCPLVGATEWNSTAIAPPLTVGLQTYGPTLFADTNLVGAGGAGDGVVTPDTGSTMNPFNALGAGLRALCWRLAMPPISTMPTTDVQIVPVIVTAL